MDASNKKNILLLTFQQGMVRMLPTGLLPVYPFLLTDFKASKLEIGIFMSICYLFFFLTTIVSGMLAPKYISSKNLMLATIVPAAVCLCIMGQCTSYTSFLVCTCAMIIFIGSNTTVNSIFVGQFSNKETVAKVFAWAGMSQLIASIVGTAIVGATIQLLGLKIAFPLFGIFVLLSGALLLNVKDIFGKVATASTIKQFTFKPIYLWTLFTAILCVMMIHVFKMSLSIKLKGAGWDLKQISLYASIGTLLSIGFPILIGKLIPKYGAKWILLSTYATTALAMLLLPHITAPWQVILGVSLISILAYASRPAIIKLIFEWYTPNDIPQAQSYQGGAAWIAAIIGYLFTGILLEKFGLESTAYLCVGLIAVAMVVLGVALRKTKK
jgi:MFS family permease